VLVLKTATQYAKYARSRPQELLIGLLPWTYRYLSTQPDDGALWAGLKEQASRRRRFGYRRPALL